MKTKIGNSESIIESMVLALYFPDHMKERKIDILQFVEKDIKEVLNPLCLWHLD